MEKNAINRREFISKSTFGILSTSLHLPLLKSKSIEQEQKHNIVYRTLGRTNLRIPIVSFGVMNSDSPDLLRRALDRGITHLDTAHLYLRGNSEKVIGEVVEERKCRDKVYIATKMRFARDRKKKIFVQKGNEREPGASEDNLYKQLDVSLERLRTDYIDILYLHSCYSPEMATYEPLMKALIKVKESGKARFIGVSTHSNEPQVIRASVDTGVYDVILTAYNFLQKHKEEVRKAIQYATKKGVGIIAMKTQCGARINEKTNIDHATALKWVLNDENVCSSIPGMTTFEQLDLNISVMNNLGLTAAENRELQLASQIQGTFYCQNCRSCISSCSNKVEIPNLMRAFMYAEGYGNLYQARTSIAELPKRNGINACQNCSSCVAICKNGINIQYRLQNLIDKGFCYC